MDENRTLETIEIEGSVAQEEKQAGQAYVGQEGSQTAAAGEVMTEEERQLMEEEEQLSKEEQQFEAELAELMKTEPADKKGKKKKKKRH